MPDGKKIGVFLSDGSLVSRRLLDGLREIIPVEFVTLDTPDAAHCDAGLLFGVSREVAARFAADGRPCLAYIKGLPKPLSPVLADVQLSETPYLARCLRGVSLPDETINRICPFKLQENDTVVARRGDDVLWIRNTQGNSTVDLVAMEPPNLPDNHYLFECFQPNSWARLLPLLHFLREISGWELPPLRACFMFDDPNLHWQSYGYVRYPQLIQHAQKHNYHVSIATVPSDGWYVHQPAAGLFRENQSRISLLIHGNNHTRKELAQSYSDQNRQALVAQALRRIERLERLSGLEVSRVMAAPHGACTEEMAKVLFRMGFEAACISRGSIMSHNPQTPWPATVGLQLAEFMGGALPVIPRFGLDKDCRANVALAAFLGQAIIPMAHHEELAAGLDLLQELADFINSIGEVLWTDMKSIAQTNFCTRRESGVLHIKTYSQKIRLSVPEGYRRLCIQSAWHSGNHAEGLTLQKRWSILETINAYQGEPVPVTPGDEVLLTSIYPDMIDLNKVPISRPTLWAIARRQLCEVRDRLRPTMDRLLPLRARRKC